MLKTKIGSKNLWELKNGELKPFFWLGDTAWLLLQKLSIDEIEAYLDNRAERRFNVIQAVLVHNENYERDGELAIDLSSPSDSAAFWDKAELLLKLAEKRGMHVAYLPVWGSMVKTGRLNINNAEAYAEFLTERLRSDNLIWVLGGDIRGETGFEVWNIMGRTLKRLCPDALVTFHPFGRTSSAQWFAGQEWLDFNMFQSGHRRYDQCSLGEWDDNKESEDFFAEDNWRYVRRELSGAPLKPVLDGEPSYENIPQGLHDAAQPMWRAKDVRRYAYWSVLEGACGHTYGCNSVMQFYRPGDTPSYSASEYWTDGICLPGATHMKYLYELMTAFDFAGGSHSDECVSNAGFSKHDRITAFGNDDFMIIYDYSGREFELADGFCEKYTTARWFDPTNGKYAAFKLNSGVIRPPHNSCGETDMVLVLE